MTDWHREFAPGLNTPNVTGKVDAIIRAIRENMTTNPEPKQISLVCRPYFFRKLMRAVRQKLKRQWREQRKQFVGIISKSDWLASKGLRKEWQ